MKQNLAQPESAQNWNGFALSPIFYERPNSFTAFIRRKLADADKATIRATEEGHTERLAELTAYKVTMRKLLAWPGQGFAPIPPPMPGYAPAEPEYIDRVERVEEPEPPPPYVPDFTLIPDGLARFALADETADDFRRRAFQLLFRFGIAEGENFEGGGEPLTPEEKITLLPMLIANFEAGNWLNLKEDLKPE